MNIAICDDKLECRENLRMYAVQYFKDKHIDLNCALFENGRALLEDSQPFDIVFLDIEMPELDGIATAKEINRKNSKTVIFIITAYQKYLDEAMDLHVLRYINKPINPLRFYAGLDKAVAMINDNDIGFHRREGEYISLRKSDIAFVEVSGKTVSVHTREQTYTALERMDYFRERLTASYFAVPHNSYIINMNFAKAYQRNVLSLISDREYRIPIATKKQTDIRRKFTHFFSEDYKYVPDTV